MGRARPGLSQQLLDASEPSDVAKVLLDELAEAFQLDLANMALIEDDGLAAVIVAAREGGKDNIGLVGKRVALDREPSGINAAVREGRAFTVYDAEHSAVVNQRLNAIAKAKSCVYVPVRAADEVIGVVFGAVRRPRVFDEEELGRMQAFVSEGGLALERSRATIALADALERERLISHVSLELRSRRNVDEVLPAVLAEIGVVRRRRPLLRQARRAGRCDWRGGRVARRRRAAARRRVTASGRQPLCASAAHRCRGGCPGDTCARGRQPRRRPRALRARRARRARDADPRAGAASRRARLPPLDRRRLEPGEIALAEAVAREAAVALDTSRLLRESDRRLAEQEALLKAGEALTSDLRFDVVIERLVSELRALVNADAADCWTLLPGGSELVCRAVLGLPEEEVGRTIPVAGTIGEAITTGKPVLRRELAETEQPRPADGGADFVEVMDAPISSFGEIRGALGVYSREAGRFEESDLRLIEAFASLASIALRNAEAYEESTRQAQVERGFYRIAAVLSEPLSEQETLDAVAQAAADALGGDSAAVLRGAGAALELAGALRARGAARGAPPRRARRRWRRVPAAARCWRPGDSATTTASATGLGPRRPPPGRGSLLAVPLPAARGRGAGLVLVFFAGRARVRRRAARARGAGRGGRARRARAQRALRARAPVAPPGAATRPVRAASSPASSIPTTCSTQSVRHAVQLLGADGASVRMLEGDEVVVRAVAGPGGTTRSTRALRRPAWLVGDIVQTRATRAITDVARRPAGRRGRPDARRRLRWPTSACR